MLAIPSPDLVVNLFASAGQVLGLLSVAAGGAAVSMRRKGGPGSAARATSRRLAWLWGGLFALTAVSFVLYHFGVQDARNARLRANLFRDSTEAGEQVGDTSLVTLPFSEQVAHPAALSTDALAAAIARGEPLNLIDVREPEEVEGGRIAGSWHVRYPDLQHDREGLVREGARTVLLCYSGNRSSELAMAFREDGIECSFLAGGYEKWIAEGRPLEKGDVAKRRALRELPPFPNADVLLDTPDVESWVREHDAIFVDVRYPEDFARDHIPGAINVPLRKLLSPEIEERLAHLPRRPVIVPCYDKRSSFYALILGLRLHRLGGEFAGRYTVPHEYFVPRKGRAHVAAWEEMRAGLTPFGMLEGALGGVLGWLRDALGSLALAVVLLVVLVRGAFLPFAWKQDVDGWVRRALAPEERRLRNRFADDPVRAQRAILDLHRRHRLTPGRNLAVSLVQIVLFLAFFAVVQNVATGSQVPFLWIPELGSPDPLKVLPALVGVLMAAIVLSAPLSATRVAVAVAVGIGLTALTWNIVAAGNLYLVTSLSWIVVQGLLARLRVTRCTEARVARKVDPNRHVVTLAEAADVPGAGNKAIRLGRMKQAGLPVPDGFAITDRALERGRAQGGLSRRDRLDVRRAFGRLGADCVAVRSSGLNEDGGQKSYAGVFDSVLNVDGERLVAAVDEVLRSMVSDRAQAYGEGDERGGILVQEMVPAVFAGVLFTEHPTCAGTMVVELVEGLGDRLVGGEVTPRTIEFTRTGGRRVRGDAPPLNLTPLLELGRRVEKLFGAPQDIEWAFANGRFQLLQARDITVAAGAGSTPSAVRERERARLLAMVCGAEAEEVVFAQNELSELLPNPTPFSIAFMNSLWAPGGTVDLACRSLGVPFAVSEDSADYVVDVFGSLFVNRREEKARLGRGLGMAGSFRLTRSANSVAQEFREEFLPRFRSRMRLLEATDPERLDDEALFELWRDVRREFVTSTYAEAERINIVADYFVKSAGQMLRRRGFEASAVLAEMPQTVVHRAYEMLPAVRDGKREPADFLALFGHRAPHDFEFSESRYAEDSKLVDELIRRSSNKRERQVEGTAGEAKLGRFLQLRVARARMFQALKEDAKHEAVRELAVFRRLTLEIGRRVGLEDRVLWLTPDEVDALQATGADAATVARIEEREFRAEAFEEVELPVWMTVDDLETLRLDGGPTIPRAELTDGLHGKRVAGTDDVVGRVRVLRNASEIDSFEPGEILVARFTDPSWAPVFPLAAGLVTEVGGWLSHAAIQAREYGLAAIVDARGAMRALRTGDVVRLGLDGSVVRMTEHGDAADTGRILEFGRPGAADDDPDVEVRKSAGM